MTSPGDPGVSAAQTLVDIYDRAVPQLYGYFLPRLFTPPAALPDKLAAGDPVAYLDELVAGYREPDDPQEWFDQIRELAARHDRSVRDAAQIVRVALTGSTRSPDLYAVARCLGRDEVRRRLAALAAALR